MKKPQQDVQPLDPEIQRLIDSDQEIKVLRQFKTVQSDRKSRLETQAFIEKRIAEILRQLDR